MLGKRSANEDIIDTLDNTKSHAKTMQLLAEAGIYVLVGLSTASLAINRLAPTQSYTTGFLDHYFSTIDCIADFPNVLGLISSNEVINSEASMKAAPVLKAVIRDCKSYIALRHAHDQRKRLVPVGVAATDKPDYWIKQARYFTTGSDPMANLDFFAVNSYNLSGRTSTRTSCWQQIIDHFRGCPVPLFLSEYSTEAGRQGSFKETVPLYERPMTEVFSGGCVYELCWGPNGFGLVKEEEEEGAGGPEGTPNRVLKKLDHFEDLKESMRIVEENLAGGADSATVSSDDGTRIPSDGDAQGWDGKISINDSMGPVTDEIPEYPGDWEMVVRRVRDRD